MDKIKKTYLAVVFVAASVLVTCCNNNINAENEKFVPAPQTLNEALMLELVNEYRLKGCNCGDDFYGPAPLLTWNDTLELAAYNHSYDMNKKNFFDHKGSNGSMVNNRIEKYNYNWTAFGENIANGYKTEKEVVDAWIKSTGHCKNIMNTSFKEIGVARVEDYWTQVFGTQ